MLDRRIADFLELNLLWLIGKLLPVSREKINEPTSRIFNFSTLKAMLGAGQGYALITVRGRRLSAKQSD